VQKSCSLSGHVWDGYWVLGNKRSFARLPADLQNIVTGEINRSAVNQRADIARLGDSLKAELTAKGITFVEIDREAFRKALAGTPFYAEWKQKYGDAAWGILEKTVGRLG
jgi:TRAP-type C4-dicarboxylate transport system substrate-binding protein